MYFKLSYWTTAGLFQACQTRIPTTPNITTKARPRSPFLSRRDSKSCLPYFGSTVLPRLAGGCERKSCGRSRLRN